MHKHAKSCLLFLLLFAALRGNAQKAPPNIVKYYKLINKAEMALLDNQPRRAAKYYNIAFRKKYPNGKDLHNAFLLALHNGDSLAAKRFLDTLAAKGYVLDRDKIDSFEHTGYITASYDSIYEWYSIFKEETANSSGKIARSFFDSVKMRDQNVRMKEEVSNYEFIKADTENVRLIKNYIYRYGFPSFSKVGYWPLFDWKQEYMGALHLVLWHIRCVPYARNMIDSVMEQAVVNGEYDPSNWAFFKAIGNTDMQKSCPRSSTPAGKR